MAAEAFAPAKVNLTLHVLGRRPDGYHLLDSLVVFAGVGDGLRAEPSADLTLRVEGPMAAGVPDGPDNLVLRAAALLREARGVTEGAALTLVKRLPHGGGIGGGSSDAAAAIRLLAGMWRVAPLDPAEALRLGADVPVCLHAPLPVRMTGIGERLVAVPPLPRLWLVLVNPGVALATAAVFGGLRPGARPPMDDLPHPLAAAAFLRWLGAQRNDLTDSASRLSDAIPRLLAALRAQVGCAVANMSGSGSTCWALFRDEADAVGAVRSLSDAGYWTALSPIGL